MKIIKIPMTVQPTRAKALERAHQVLAAACAEFHIEGRLVYHNDKVQLLGMVPLEVTLNIGIEQTEAFRALFKASYGDGMQQILFNPSRQTAEMLIKANPQWEGADPELLIPHIRSWVETRRMLRKATFAPTYASGKGRWG